MGGKKADHSADLRDSSRVDGLVDLRVATSVYMTGEMRAAWMVDWTVEW
jgi:hypothetical protein